MFDDDFDDPAVEEGCSEDSLDATSEPAQFDTTNVSLNETIVDALPRPEPDDSWRSGQDFQGPALGPVPGLFHRNSINLLIGPAYVGKTVLGLSQYNAYLTRGSFLGFQLGPSDPKAQCSAVIATQGLSTLYTMLQTAHLETLLDPVAFPIHPWTVEGGDTLYEALVKLWRKQSRVALRPIQFMYIEGLQSLLESGKVNDPKSVQEFYSVLRQFCGEYRVTILGTVIQSKMRKGETYSQLGDRVYGSVVWASEADTLVGIEQLMLHLPMERRPTLRKVSIQTRDRQEIRWVDFDERGRLEIVDLAREMAQENPAYVKLDLLLEKIAPGAVLSREEIMEWGENPKYGIEVSERTVERWIASRTDPTVGLLEKVGGGKRAKGYRKPHWN